MKTKIRFITLFILSFLLVMTTSCAKDDITKDYLEYNSVDDEVGADIFESSKTAFSLKYPQEWETSWASDSGVVAYLMASEDLETVWSAQDHDSATIMIVGGVGFTDSLSAGVPIESLPNDWVEDYELIQEPKAMKINGHDAVQAIHYFGDEIRIVTIIVEENADLLILASTPKEKDVEFRPILEAIISTIKLRSSD